MYRKIIVGYDGSPQAEDAVALGKLLADPADASLIVAGVFFPSRMLSGRDVLQDLEAEQVRRVEAAAASVGARPEATAASSAGRGLQQLAEDIDADLIVVGSAHHGKAGQILAGSVGMSVLHGSPCSVAIAPHGFADATPEAITAITVGFDGSPEAALALGEAVELARATRATVKVVAVAEPPTVVYGKSSGRNYAWEMLRADLKERMREHLDRARELVPDDIQAEMELAEGAPEDALAKVTAEAGGVLMLGARGYGPLRRVLLGSVSTALVRSAPCPLIVHPRPAKVQEPTAEPATTATAG